MKEAPDYPMEIVAFSVRKHMEAGHKCYQKFTCQHCGSRQTIAEPNKLFTTGRCEECNNVTDIRVRGCNYMVEGPVESVMRVLKLTKSGR